MSVDEAIRKAEALLPGEPAAEDQQDPRWQAIIGIGEYIETEPEAVWQFIRTWGGHPQEDLRAAVATCLLEHLLECHFALYFSQAQRLALSEPLFGDTFLTCWKLGQSAEPGNTARFDRLKNQLRRRRRV